MRPLSDADRQARKDLLADRAADLFAQTGWTGLTIDAVARSAGVAKGTVFLAFAGKEDLMLHAVARRFDLWFDRLDQLVAAPRAADLARAVLATLKADPLLLPLLALVGPVLEEGCSAEGVLVFKQTLAHRTGQLADRWSRWTPGLPQEAWAQAFLQLYAAIVGCWSVGATSDRVGQALAGRPELAWLLHGFDDLFLPLAEARLARLL